MIEVATDQYTVARLSPANIDELAVLHHAVYGKTVAADLFPKKYDTAFTGVQHVGLIAYNADKVAVAFYGVIPCFIEYGGQLFLAAQSADTMTHPKHRFKGMFVDLSNKTFELCKELGIKLVFGFPNQNSYHGAVHKLGWKQTDVMGCFIIDVKAMLLPAMGRKLGFLKGLYKGYAGKRLKKYLVEDIGLSNSALTDGFAGLHRSEEFLNYKTYSPTQVISIDGVKIWFSLKQTIMIGDMEGLSANNFKEVMKKLMRLTGQLGIKQIQFHCSPGTTIHKLFKENIEEKPSYPVLFQDFGSAVPPEKIKFTFADIDIF